MKPPCQRYSFVSWNIHDAHSRIEGNKLESSHFLSATSDAHFICLQETKRPVKMEGFRCFNNNRAKSNSGGVCIAVRNDLAKWASPVSCSHPDIISLRIRDYVLGVETLLICAYDSPDASSYKKSGKGTGDQVTEVIGDLIAELGLPAIVLGDFNARLGNKARNEHAAMQPELGNEKSSPLAHLSCPRLANLPERSCEDSKENAKGTAFLEMVRTQGLVIANGRTVGDIFGATTCIRPNGTSTVDYCCMDIDLYELVDSFSVADLHPISDHRPLKLAIMPLREQQIPNVPTQVVNFSLAPAGYVWERDGCTSSSKFLLQQMEPNVQEHLQTLLKRPLNSREDVHELNNLTSALLGEIADETLKRRQASKRSNPWYDKDCRKAKRVLDKSCKKLSKNYSDAQARQSYHSAKRRYRNVTRRKKSNYLWRLNKKICEQNPRQINWPGLKRLKNETSSNINFDTADLHNFYRFFKDLYSTKCTKTANEHPSPDTELAARDEETANQLSNPISMAEMTSGIEELKTGKSPSLDQVTNEMLRCSSKDLKAVILKLFNGCLSVGCYPWNESVVTVLHKKGPTENPDNYRAITLGSCVGKLYSSILLKRLALFRSKVCPDTPNQQGFAKGGQTNDHVLVLKTILEKYLKKKKQRVIACFVDYRKAFDKVCRVALLKKLSLMGVCGGFFSSITDMYENSSSSIRLSGIVSESFLVQIGTEQGHPLSPEFFKMFLDEMSRLLNNMPGAFPELAGTQINHLLWADDIVLLALERSSMENLLNVLGDYATKWEMEINTDKTKVLLFNPSGRLLKDSHHYSLLGTTLQSVKEYTYLGIVFTANGNMKAAINNLATKGTKAVYALRKAVNGDALSGLTAFKLFDALIVPILTYGCPVWLPSTEAARAVLETSSDTKTFMRRMTADPFERVHLKFIKWVLGVHKKATNSACLGETGRVPLSIAVLQQANNYFSRVMSKLNDSESLLGLAAKEQKDLRLDWFNFWSNAKTREAMDQHMVSHWEALRRTQSKLSFFNSVKRSYEFEDYLALRRADRKEVTKLRISAHDLRVETSRYCLGIPTSCRFCCDDNERQLLDNLPFSDPIKETEEHVIAHCGTYTTFRDKLPASLLSAINNRDFISLFSKPHCKQLNRFLASSRRTREPQ